jgi:hypothetical protein
MWYIYMFIYIYVIYRYIDQSIGVLFRQRRNSVNCRKKDGSGGHYAKWNEPEPRKQVLHIFSLT